MFFNNNIRYDTPLFLELIKSIKGSFMSVVSLRNDSVCRIYLKIDIKAFHQNCRGENWTLSDTSIRILCTTLLEVRLLGDNLITFDVKS